jgi:hypothetical protein
LADDEDAVPPRVRAPMERGATFIVVTVMARIVLERRVRQ